MKPIDALHTSLRALRVNVMRSVLTTLGIIIGVGAVIVMVSMGAGAEAQLEGLIRSLGANLIIVLPAFAITAVKLFREAAVGDLLAGLLLIKFVSLCVSITLGQAFRAVAGLPVESELLVIFVVLGLTGLIFTALYFRNLIPET